MFLSISIQSCFLYLCPHRNSQLFLVVLCLVPLSNCGEVPRHIVEKVAGMTFAKSCWGKENLKQFYKVREKYIRRLFTKPLLGGTNFKEFYKFEAIEQELNMFRNI